MVWQSANQDGQFYGIFAQRFDSAGAKIGVEFQVNTYTTGTQSQPSVAMNDGGGFVVVWRSGSNQDGSDYGVFGRRFASSGAAQGVEFQVNETTTGPQVFPAVAIDDQGDFVVVWQTSDGYGGATGIFGRRFGSDGGALAGDFRVNTYTLYTQRYPAIAGDADGDFVVTWDSRDQEGGVGSYGVFAQRFDSLGAVVGGEFQVNSHTTGSQFFSTVAAADGGAFVVAWQSYHDGSGSGIFGRPLQLIGRPARRRVPGGAAHHPAADPPVDRRRFRRRVPGGVDRQRSRRQRLRRVRSPLRLERRGGHRRLPGQLLHFLSTSASPARLWRPVPPVAAAPAAPVPQSRATSRRSGCSSTSTVTTTSIPSPTACSACATSSASPARP